MKWVAAHAGKARRGLTLLEVLVAVSVLAVLTALSLTWMNVAITKQHEALGAARWDRAASAVLDQIARDVLQIDVLNDRGTGEPRVWIADNSLCIRSSNQEAVKVIRYKHEADQHRLVRHSSESHAPPDRDPPMLGSVSEAQFTLTVLGVHLKIPELRVSLRSAGGRLMERTFLLDPGDTAS